MVSVLSGFLSSTLWRVVGGSDSRPGQDSKPGAGVRSDGQSRIRRMFSGLDARRPRFTRKSVPSIHDSIRENKRIKNTPFSGFDEFLKTKKREEIENSDLKQTHGENGNRGQENEPELVIFDASSLTDVTFRSSMLSARSPGEMLEKSSATSVSDIDDDPNFLSDFDRSRILVSKRMPTAGVPQRLSCTDRITTSSPICSLSSQRISEHKSDVPGNLCSSDKHRKERPLFNCTPGQVKNRSTMESRCIGDHQHVFDARAVTSNISPANQVTVNSARVDSISPINIATAGNYGARNGLEASARQCVSVGRVNRFDSCGGSDCVKLHTLAMSTANTTKGNDMKRTTTSQTRSEEIEGSFVPSLVTCQSDNNKESPSLRMECDGEVSNNGKSGYGSVSTIPPSVSSVSLPVAFREDIRAYDIYQIPPHPTPGAHYSRLPSAPPTLTDSDSDPDDVRLRQGIRKRKRRISGRRGEKRYREGEETDEEEGAVGLDDITIYSSPSLEDYTNRISVMHRLSSAVDIQDDRVSSSPSSGNSQRRVSFSPGTPHHHLQHSHTYLSTPNTASLPPTNPPSKQTSTNSGDDVSDSSSSNDDDDDNDDHNDDDDDDEASTVVPDDFDDETDSDIEVLVQS
ncbi:hypothetical protein SK128_006888, partial [Halocaridina rubra]